MKNGADVCVHGTRKEDAHMGPGCRPQCLCWYSDAEKTTAVSGVHDVFPPSQGGDKRRPTVDDYRDAAGDEEC